MQEYNLYITQIRALNSQAPEHPEHAASRRRAARTAMVLTVFRTDVHHILGKKMHLQWGIMAFYFRSDCAQVA